MVKRAAVKLNDSRFPNTDIFSVRADNVLENGFVGKLGEIELDNHDVRALVKPAAEDQLVLIANPALVYDNNRQGTGLETDYVMDAEQVVRAYMPHPTYVFSVTEEAIEGTHTIGEFLVAGTDNKLVPASTAPTKGFVGKVIREDKVGGALALNVKHGGKKYVVIETVINSL